MDVFNGKVAIITGAGSGIGKGLAGELSGRGAQVVISDVNAERIEKIALDIRKTGGKVTSSVIDVSDYEAVRKMIDDTVAAYGRIDYIFNNAGIAVVGAADDFSIDDWRKVIDINLIGVVNGVAVAYPIMVRQGFGHIVNTASIEGLAPLTFSASYVTSKYGVVGLTSALRIEGALNGVKVSAVCPGYVKTSMFKDFKVIKVDRKKLTPPDWAGVTPEECAKLILHGIERNKAFIVVTPFAKIFWMLNRISPDLVIWLMKKNLEKARKIVKIP
jgi:NAD(P)-dependent dehydrogenase (short-subunit alcohol dehydrogenase family)